MHIRPQELPSSNLAQRSHALRAREVKVKKSSSRARPAGGGPRLIGLALRGRSAGLLAARAAVFRRPTLRRGTWNWELGTLNLRATVFRRPTLRRGGRGGFGLRPLGRPVRVA
jgi:hypothetical protein